MSMLGLSHGNMCRYDILTMADIEDKKESKLKTEVTSFFKTIENDSHDFYELQLDIYCWMRCARSMLSLGHETYFQSLCAIYSMLNNKAYKQYIKKNDISVNLKKERNLDSDAYWKAKFGKFFFNVFLSCFLSQGVQYGQKTCKLLSTWESIITGASKQGYETGDLSKLQIKGKEFMPSSEEKQSTEEKQRLIPN